MKYKHTRRVVAALAALLFTAIQSHAQIGFIDIDEVNKIGTGANKSGLVIDFNDGAATERYVFQYNWDGAASTVSGAEMITDVAAGIAALSFTSSGTIEDGFYLTEMVFDSQSQVNGDFVNDFDYWGYFIAGGDANGAAVAGAGETMPMLVDGSPVGAAEAGFGDPGRFIANNSWDVWSFGPYNSTYAVPEPSAYALFTGVFAVLVVTRRRVNQPRA